MSEPLTGKVALVTGGSRGLGAATVRLLAAQGADVGFTYVNSEKPAQAVVDEVRGTGAKVAAFRSDQADPSGAPALIDEVVAQCGQEGVQVGRHKLILNSLQLRLRRPAIRTYSSSSRGGSSEVSVNPASRWAAETLDEPPVRVTAGYAAGAWRDALNALDPAAIVPIF